MQLTKTLFKTIDHYNFRETVTAREENSIPNLWSFYFKTPAGNILFPYRDAKNIVILGARTQLEALKLMEETNFESDGFIVMQNADFTEGRGQMNFHKAFKDYDKAVSYIMQQEVIFGSKQGSTISLGKTIKNEIYGSVHFNGYSIRSIKFEDETVKGLTKQVLIEMKIKEIIARANYMASGSNNLVETLTLSNVKEIIKEIGIAYSHEYSIEDFFNLLTETKTFDATALQISFEIPHYDGETS